MPAMKCKTKRAKKLDSIMTRIAMYIVENTYTDEPDAQKHLSNAIRSIEAAQKLIDEAGE